MEALIAISSLGLVIMLIELLGLRKILIPFTILGLLAILYLNFIHWNEPVIKYYNDMYVVNKTTTIFNAVILVIAVFIAFLAGDYYKEDKKHWSDYLSIYMFAVCGAMLMIGAHHLLMTFIGIEILSVSLYVLAGSNRTKLESNEAGMKYFLMGSFASGILLFGFVLLYGATGTLHYEKLNLFLNSHSTANLGFLYSGLALILVGFFFKVSAAPFHFWSPDVYQGSPSIVTAFMATVAKIAAIVSLFLVVNSIHFIYPIYHFQNAVLIMVSIATISVGNILAIIQSNFKRMMAYSGISHAGFMLIGILAFDFSQWHLMAYYAVGYGIANLIGFGVAMAVFKSTKSENISALNGLFFKRPVLAVTLTIALLSMASIPPMAGFWGKYYILSAALSKDLVLLVLIAIINTVLSVYFYFKIFVALYVRRADNTPVDVTMSYKGILILLTFILIAISLIPDMIARLL